VIWLSSSAAAIPGEWKRIRCGKVEA